MNGKSVERFRSFFKLSDLFECNEQVDLSSDLFQLVNWYVEERHKSSGFDASLLGGLFSSEPRLKHGLFLYFATLDEVFRRYVSHSLGHAILKGADLGPVFREMAAALLFGAESIQPKPSTARHALATIAIGVAAANGRNPTRSITKPKISGVKHRQESGCELAAEKLRLTYYGAEDIWKDRRRILQDAGFSEAEVSRFLTASGLLQKNPR